jgi:general secretion pathway protein K
MRKRLLNKQKTQHSGVALVVVLWVVSLLAMIAASFALTMRRDTGVAMSLSGNARAHALAEAGVAYAEFMLSQPDAHKRWRSNGAVYRLPQASGEIRVAIYAESGKVDINASDESQLAALIGYFVADVGLKQSIVEAVLDWRDADEEARPAGAERKQYQQAGKTYVPANMAFQNLEELQLLLPMTPELYQQLRPWLTVYSGAAQVNQAEASLTVLQALSAELNKHQTHDAGLQQQVQQSANGGNADEEQQPQVFVNGDQAYTIISEVKWADGAQSGLQVVVKMQSGISAAPGFKILDWNINTQGLTLFANRMDASVITVEDEFTNND